MAMIGDDAISIITPSFGYLSADRKYLGPRDGNIYAEVKPHFS
jgi:hypothetical protein